MATPETPAQDATPVTPATPVIPETEAQAATVETGKDGKPFDPERAQALIEKLQRENSELKPKAKRAAELEAAEQIRADAELSETDRLKKENERLAAETAKTKLDLMRRDAIDAAGLPAEFATRLHGETAEELATDAKALAKALPTLKVAPKVNSTNPANATQNETYEQKRERLLGPATQDPFGGGGLVTH